jgi:hypothetical protein
VNIVHDVASWLGTGMEYATISFTVDGRAETLRRLTESLMKEAAAGVERADESESPRPIGKYLVDRREGPGSDHAELSLLGPVAVYEKDPRVTRARARVLSLAYAMTVLKTTRDPDHGTQFELWIDLLEEMKNARRALGRTVRSAREALEEKLAFDPYPERGAGLWLPKAIETWETTCVILEGLQEDLGRELVPFSADEFNRARPKGGVPSRFLLGQVVDALRHSGPDGSRAFTFREVLYLVTDDTAASADAGRLERYKRAVRVYRELEKKFPIVATAKKP